MFFEPVESKTRTYHGQVGSGRPAELPGEGSGKIECQQNYSLRKQRSTVPSKQSRNAQQTKVASTFFQKHEQAKPHVNRRRNKISG